MEFVCATRGAQLVYRARLWSLVQTRSARHDKKKFHAFQKIQFTLAELREYHQNSSGQESNHTTIATHSAILALGRASFYASHSDYYNQLLAAALAAQTRLRLPNNGHYLA